MSLPSWNAPAWLYYGAVVLCGAVVIALSMSRVIQASSDVSWLFLTIPLVLSRRTYIQLPACEGRICPSGFFVLYTGLVWGAPQAALLAVIDAALNSLDQTAQGLRRLVFNLATLPIAMFSAATLSRMALDSDVTGGLELVLQAAVMTLVYYAVNMTLVLGAIGLTHGRKAVTAARGALLWSWAAYLASGTTATLLALWGVRLPVVMALGLGLLLLTCRTLNHYFSVLKEREAALCEVRATHLATLETLALAIEAKDPLTHGHVQRVQRLAVALGEKLGMSAPDLEDLRIGALVHDIGKLAIPEYLLYRSDKLTAEDEQKLRNHAWLGSDILRHSRLSDAVLEIVRHHHERFDGTGYPNGLLGEDTIFGARVLTVADTYDGLRHPHGGDCLSHRDALKRIAEESGSGFDPDVIEALFALPADLFEALDAAPAECKAWAPGHPARGVAEPKFVASHRHNRALYTLSAGLRGVSELKPATKLMASSICEVVPCSAVIVMLPSLSGEELEVIHLEGMPTGELERIPAGRWKNVLRAYTGRGQRPNAPVCGLLPELARFESGQLGAFTAFVLPLGTTGHGLVALCHPEDFNYDEEEGRFVNLLLKEAGPTIDSARSYERYRRESLTDALTGLANSRALREQGQGLIDATVQAGGEGCVVVMDLNGFKLINDTFGHHEGDRLLVQVARTMGACVRAGDLAARNGGDEFVMILRHVDRETLRDRLETLQYELGCFWPAGWERTGTSAGVAWFPMEGGALEDLMQEADTRMYIEKRTRTTRGGLSLLEAV